MSISDIVSAEEWTALCRQMADGQFNLLSLWGDDGFARMAVWNTEENTAHIVCIASQNGAFPSVAQHHPPALRLERAIKDLFGLVPLDTPDDRPWLDHDKWGVSAPLEKKLPPVPSTPYVFLPVEGESLHKIPVGPVHAGIIEPGHFRFTASGETVVRLEERLGYVHKGIERLMAGADLSHAVKLAGRVSGDSAVAYQLAFSRAAEKALDIKVPPRAHWLRALMAELERIANHFGDIGAICNDAAFSLMLAHCGVLRERVLRAADACFGHRLMRDLIVPGGVKADIGGAEAGILRALLEKLQKDFPPLVRLYDNTPTLLERTVGTGILRPRLARQYAAGGYIGRASGRDFDARRMAGYSPYEELNFEVPVRVDSDVHARVWIRILEVQQSLALIGQILNSLPEGEIAADVPPVSASCEGFALVEGFRGDIFVWLALGEDGRVRRCHLRDPSWFQWPLLEAAIEGNIVADFPLCNKSFNCSYSGHDL